MTAYQLWYIVEQDKLEEYKCKFCDTMIIGGYRCIDCYLNKIDKMPTKPYKEGDLPLDYDPLEGIEIPQRLPGYPYLPNPLTDEARLRGFRYDPFQDLGTAAGTETIDIQPNTTAGTTYNPWFRNTWHKQYDTSATGTTVDFSSGTNSQDIVN